MLFITESEDNSDGIIVLLDTPEMALRFFQTQNSGNISLVLSINKVGLQAWQVPHSFSNLFILQQTRYKFNKVKFIFFITSKTEPF